MIWPDQKTICRTLCALNSISIGIWITNEINRMRLGKSENFGGLIEIRTIIRDGLN